MKKRVTETWFAWLLPLSPVFSVPTLIGLSFRGRTALASLRNHRWDLSVWTALALSGLISIFGGYDVGQGFLNWLIPFVFVWAYCLGRWTIVAPKQFLLAILRGTALLAAVIIVARVFQLSVHIGDFPILADFEPWGRGIVLGVYSNGLAIVLEAGAVGGLGLLFASRRLRDRLEAAFIFALSVAAIFITMSRGAFVGVAAGILTGGVLFSPLAALPLALVGGTGLLVSPQLRERFQSIIDVTSDASNIGRLRIWEGTWRLIKEHFWFGVGPGSFGKVYPLHAVQDYGHYLTPHSVYLNLISEWGFVGGALFFGWNAWVIVRTIVRGAKPLQKAIVMILVAFWAHVLFDDLIALYIPLLLGILENERLEKELGDASS